MKIFLFLVFFLLPVLASGQTSPEKSTLTGLVYDDYGAVIANAVVKVRGADNIENVFRTNSDGVFEIKLKPGNYAIQIESPGFQTFSIDKYRVVSSYKGKQNLDIALEVGPCNDCHWIEADPVKKGQDLESL